MSTDAQTTLLTAILDSLTSVQGQLARIERRGEEVDRQLSELHGKLEQIDLAQAGGTDIVPTLETMLARMIDDRQFATSSFVTLANLGAFTHAAASGKRASLPTEIVDAPLLERFMLTQPADLDTPDQALGEWRRVVASASTAELTELLANQYQPSPTDTPETRVLRYRLAAITRSTLEDRGAALPALPEGTIAQDRSAAAREARSAGLADLWRAGASTALFGEPELAGAVALFANAERRAESIDEAQLAVELATLHRRLGQRIEAGERPAAGEGRSAHTGDRSSDVDETWQR